ncbi:ImmA/IrrE family metallo-endopeptidase [Devosia sp. A449]
MTPLLMVAFEGMSEALINSDMLTWAMERAALSESVLAKRVNVSADRVAEWLSGASRPTFRQAQIASSALHVPFGYLFLKEPPQEDLPIPDLRTLGSDPAYTLDLNFRDLLQDIMFKRDWFRDFLIERGSQELPFVGKFDVNAAPTAVAADMRSTLFGSDGAPSVRNWEEYLRALMRAAEDAGIWVLRNGVVGSNTSRPLSVQQFRGFAISDTIIPLVFINGRDAKAAQIFTLAHELAHIWLGASGISNVQIREADYGAHRRLEKTCNAIAAEFLVPSEDFRPRWSSRLSLDENADTWSRHYRVSRIVVVRRALDLGLISQADYGSFYARESKRWADAGSDGSGGDFYKTLPIRNGHRFTRHVASQAMSGQLLLKHAASLLNTQPSSVVKFYRKATAV